MVHLEWFRFLSRPFSLTVLSPVIATRAPTGVTRCKRLCVMPKFIFLLFVSINCYVVGSLCDDVIDEGHGLISYDLIVKIKTYYLNKARLSEKRISERSFRTQHFYLIFLLCCINAPMGLKMISILLFTNDFNEEN